VKSNEDEAKRNASGGASSVSREMRTAASDRLSS